MTAPVLATLALLLCGPVPAALAHLPSIRLVPGAALVLWQAVALAAVLAALGASASWATDRALARSPQWWQWLAVALALGLTVLVLGRLLWSGHVVGRRLRTLRRRHRELVDLLATGDADVWVLEHAAPMAYCVPGLRRPRLVLSSAAVAALPKEELAAVLAHERAHLQARHDLVLEAFTVLHRAFPRWVSSAAALSEVQLLVELLADRVAVRRVGARPLARALVTLAGSDVPESALAAGGTGVVTRVELLSDHARHPWLALATYTVAGVVLVLPTALVALPWVTSLATQL